MRFPATYTFRDQLSTGVTGFTGATGAVLNGNPLDSGLVGQNSLAAKVAVALTATGLTATANWQVQDDDGTWINAVSSNNAAAVSFGTGAGATGPMIRRYISAPEGVIAGNRFCRVQVVTAGAQPSGTLDFASIAYEYRSPAAVKA